ncbi:unnamed protein product [Rotaria sordida]|uniref:Uncharacterized protein n=1 Tax=Rotaria sordida TaxID=392033 RepID=A0A815H512_9BILA|nr:unnamed protein product [Rotaria sordida]CAF1113734.1 unnamed protein product [Rotaria sordida]CAF1226993.1 unnamed protein product [Rotaria sordida]CAF1273384.1 unnamed protein product [Rotaria sordida]CAF1349339.1 unnamed protein product [Rotaria sordida]
MASPSTTVNSATLENLVKCAVCLDYYNDPRCLPCSHTFCYQCIEKLCEDGMGQCPMRDNSIIFRHTIDQLPVNRIAKDLVECIKKSSLSGRKCDHCKQILSEFICETCSKHYCTICLKLEHDINQFQTHQINIIFNENSKNFCPEHTEEKQKYWCTLCQQIVCSDCLLFKHQQHTFITLEDFAQKTKIELNSSMQQIIEMKQNLEKLRHKTTEAYRHHCHTHIKTKNRIKQTIKYLQALLDARMEYLITTTTEKYLTQQQIIRQQKTNVEEHLKIVLIRELFLKHVLNIEDHIKLIQMKNDLITYNQLITDQYQQLIEGCFFDLQHFNIQDDLKKIQQLIEDFGFMSIETFLTNCNDIQPLLKLSELSGEEKYQPFQGIYAYGYRFHLTAPLQINAVRVKVALFDQNLTLYILDYNDILIQKEIIQTNDTNSTTLKWLTIPITCQIQHNYYIFIWTQPCQQSIPLIAYRDSTNNLRQINKQVSIRSKRAQINKSTNIDINTKFDVLYDALLNNDERSQTTISAIEMILDI